MIRRTYRHPDTQTHLQQMQRIYEPRNTCETYTLTYACMHTCTHIHAHRDTHTHTHAHAHTHTHTHTHIHIHTHTCTNTQVSSLAQLFASAPMVHHAGTVLLFSFLPDDH